jgi:hypothetical protein
MTSFERVDHVAGEFAAVQRVRSTDAQAPIGHRSELARRVVFRDPTCAKPDSRAPLSSKSVTGRPTHRKLAISPVFGILCREGVVFENAVQSHS